LLIILIKNSGVCTKCHYSCLKCVAGTSNDCTDCNVYSDSFRLKFSSGTQGACTCDLLYYDIAN
jgi:hypothetical protein